MEGRWTVSFAMFRTLVETAKPLWLADRERHRKEWAAAIEKAKAVGERMDPGASIPPYYDKEMLRITQVATLEADGQVHLSMDEAGALGYWYAIARRS